MNKVIKSVFPYSGIEKRVMLPKEGMISQNLPGWQIDIYPLMVPESSQKLENVVSNVRIGITYSCSLRSGLLQNVCLTVISTAI